MPKYSIYMKLTHGLLGLLAVTMSPLAEASNASRDACRLALMMRKDSIPLYSLDSTGENPAYRDTLLSFIENSGDGALAPEVRVRIQNHKGTLLRVDDPAFRRSGASWLQERTGLIWSGLVNDKQEMNFNAAKNRCADLGARLPSLADMELLLEDIGKGSSFLDLYLRPWELLRNRGKDQLYIFDMGVWLDHESEDPYRRAQRLTYRFDARCNLSVSAGWNIEGNGFRYDYLKMVDRRQVICVKSIYATPH